MRKSIFTLLVTICAALNLANAAELTYQASPAEIYQEIVATHGTATLASQEFSPNLLFSRRSVPAVYVVVDKGEQRLHLWIDGSYENSWDVSTGVNRRVCGKSGRCYFARTPTGTFRPQSMYRRYTSRLWKARMDYSIFIIGGIALHATSDTRNLGRPASGGCVRQSTRNARYLFNLVTRHRNSTIVKIRE